MPESGRVGAILGLQRSAGNAAVTSLVGGREATVAGPTVQRQGLDDLFGPSPFGGGGAGSQGPTDSGGGNAPTPAPAPAPGVGEAPPGGINELGPVARTGTLIADSIIASSYTPGAGNVF
jgi:hypothetical protein